MSYTVPDQFDDLRRAAGSVVAAWQNRLDLQAAIRELAELLDTLGAEGEQLEKAAEGFCEHCPAQGGPCIVCGPTDDEGPVMP